MGRLDWIYRLSSSISFTWPLYHKRLNYSLRKGLKTLPYTINFQHLSIILKICLKFTTALLSAKMGVFRTKFVTENVEQHRERERERERLKTLPYTLNFQNSHNAQHSGFPPILRMLNNLKTPPLPRGPKMWSNVEKRGETSRKGEREGERLKTRPYTLNFQSDTSV